MSEIYVGNLAYDVSEDDLRNHFGSYGEIAELKIIMDRYTGKSKGFGFIKYKTPSEAEEAIKQTNGSSLKGRAMKVNLSRQKESRGGSGGGYAGAGNRY